MILVKQETRKYKSRSTVFDDTENWQYLDFNMDISGYCTIETTNLLIKMKIPENINQVKNIVQFAVLNINT
jgi:hypothetical protein